MYLRQELIKMCVYIYLIEYSTYSIIYLITLNKLSNNKTLKIKLNIF